MGGMHMMEAAFTPFVCVSQVMPAMDDEHMKAILAAGVASSYATCGVDAAQVPPEILGSQGIDLKLYKGISEGTPAREHKPDVGSIWRYAAAPELPLCRVLWHACCWILKAAVAPHLHTRGRGIVLGCW